MLQALAGQPIVYAARPLLQAEQPCNVWTNERWLQADMLCIGPGRAK